MAQVELTSKGAEIVRLFLVEARSKKKEILDAGLDTDDETYFPTAEDILDDIAWWDDGTEYYNAWGITDNYESGILHLVRGEDYDLVEGVLPAEI